MEIYIWITLLLPIISTTRLIMNGLFLFTLRLLIIECLKNNLITFRVNIIYWLLIF